MVDFIDFIIFLWLFLHECILGMLGWRVVYNVNTGDKTGVMMDPNMAAYQLKILNLVLNAIFGKHFQFSPFQGIKLLHVSVGIFESGYVRWKVFMETIY